MRIRCHKDERSTLQGGREVQCVCSRTFLERKAIARDSRVCKTFAPSARFLSTAGHVKPCRKSPGPSGKAKYILRPIVDKFREGKVKNTPGRGVK